MRKTILVTSALALVLSACATSFTGEAHVEGGPSGCVAKCKRWGLEFAGMVAMGEYSDACICHVPGRAATSSSDADSAAVAGGAAGVWMQHQRSTSSGTGTY